MNESPWLAEKRFQDAVIGEVLTTFKEHPENFPKDISEERLRHLTMVTLNAGELLPAFSRGPRQRDRKDAVATSLVSDLRKFVNGRGCLDGIFQDILEDLSQTSDGGGAV